MAAPSMFLYSLSIKPPTVITHAIIGQFSGTKEQQILTASSSRLTLYRPDPTLGKIVTLVSHDVFSIIRSIASFRLPGSPKDYIIVGADSGRIAVLEYIAPQNRLSTVHLEAFGRSAVRRVVPGQYLAADPRGRACLIASVEKDKFVYILNRNVQAELTISSPLGVHQPGVIVFSLVALDVGYANPVFASLETRYSDLEYDTSGQASPDVELVYYELDLGLNHVVRKWSEPVDPSSSLLFEVPGGKDGPSGVLVCGEESITYRHSNQEAFRMLIPRRRGATENPQRKRTIVSGVVHKLKNTPEAFFFLLQTEDGDLFKVTLDMHEDSDGNSTGEVRRIKAIYFDTIPVANSLCILKSGFLFTASEFGNHQFYQFEKLGDDQAPEFTSDGVSIDAHAVYQPTYFDPRPLENLTLVEDIDSMNPLLDCQVANFAGDAPQIYSVCGNGARSRFRMLKHGLEVNEIVVSDLPAKFSAVWTTKLAKNNEYDAYIILTSSSDTLVMSIGEEVKQVDDSGLLTSVNTMAIQQMGDDGIVQIYSKGIRHIRNGHITEWPVPQHRSIIMTTTNEQQIAIALSSGEIVYFEMDGNSLAEYDDRQQMFGTVTCLSLGQVPEGRLRSSFLAVGCDDCTVRILSVDPESTLQTKSVQALTASPSMLNIIAMTESSGGSRLYLHIGLHSGVYLRTALDEITGELSDTRQRFLGLKAVKLFQITIKGQACVLALSSKSWLGYVDPVKGFMMTPLSYEPLEWGWNFSSEQCMEGIVGIHSNFLRIFSIDNLRDNLVQRSLPLTYTPRRLVKHPVGPYFYTIESEFNTLAPELREQLLADPQVTNGHRNILPPEDFGHPRGYGRWASCISVVDPLHEQVLQKLDLEANEAATSVAVVPFTSQDGESFLVVGTGKDMVVDPRQFSAGFIHIYRFHEDGKELEFVHKTKVEEPPISIIPFQGRLAAGIGKVVRIYDLGLRQLLRKAEAAVAPGLITSLQSQGNRIIVGDVQHDKFGNLWMVRCPDKVSKEADLIADPLSHSRGYLSGAPNRLSLKCHFFAQDIPTSLTKTNLVTGVLIPFVSREDAEFFQTLEMHMRTEDPSLVGRDHLMYRGYYTPVKSVIDGDLCERYSLLPTDKKHTIAGELSRSVEEVQRKISDARTRSAF
ncbi:Pre-mRNA-splicing factor rse-1 [Xylariomycetidae sp. FL2044]|nr:Pre-mRNA-splicing factor rse-1 [Xylariomycetidae sp. FL2044]